MKTLYLLRHAKSSWKHDIDDHKRPLKGRGKRDAVLLSEYVKDTLKPPSKIIYSNAVRAQSTAVYFKETWELTDDNFITNNDLYDFGGQKVMEVIKALDDDDERIMIVGHNHAFTSIANMLGDTYIDNLPTCGFVVLKFTVDSWKNVNYGTTSKTIFPRDLKIK